MTDARQEFFMCTGNSLTLLPPAVGHLWNGGILSAEGGKVFTRTQAAIKTALYRQKLSSRAPSSGTEPRGKGCTADGLDGQMARHTVIAQISRP